MKKLFKNLMMLTAVGTMAFLYSCSEDEEPVPADPPSISVSAALEDGTAIADGGEIESGVTFQVTLTATTPGFFNAFNATAGSTTLTVTRNDLQLDAMQTSATATLDVTTESGQEGSTIDWTFTVVTEDNQTAETTFSYSVVAPPVPTGGTVDVLLGGQLNANNDSFYDLISDATYGYAATRDEQSANVDFCFFYGNTNMYTIAALDDEDANTAFSAALDSDGALSANVIETRNPTRFKVLSATEAEFDAVTNEEELNALYGGDVAADATKVNGLEAGDVFGFQLADDRSGVIGLIKITAVGGTSGADRTITFDVKFNASAIN